ncbi:DUF134 domain-containing protein [Candidatus Bathyarchaeota archaeon]|nr:DUF134 domain-containing protein [Candidatus Bathyarchaeota archaeon]
MKMRRGRRRRRGRRGRFPKPVTLGQVPIVNRFTPSPQGDPEPVYMEPAELEALRLVDLEGLSQEEAGERMGVSRGTVWRLLQGARKKTAQAITEGRPLLIASFVSERNYAP